MRTERASVKNRDRYEEPSGIPDSSAKRAASSAADSIIWRIGALLVVTGMTQLVLPLNAAFVVVGFACLFFGALVVAVALESSLTSPVDDPGIDAPEAERLSA